MGVAEQGLHSSALCVLGQGGPGCPGKLLQAAGVEQTEIFLIWISGTTFLEILHNSRVIFSGERAFIGGERYVLVRSVRVESRSESG